MRSRSDVAAGKGCRGPERICPGLGGGGAGLAGMGPVRNGRMHRTALSFSCQRRPQRSSVAFGKLPPSRERNLHPRRGLAGAGCEAADGAETLATGAERSGRAAAAGSFLFFVPTGRRRFRVRARLETGRGWFDTLDSCRLISIATGSSTELEWVFFSVTPNSGSISRIMCQVSPRARAPAR